VTRHTTIHHSTEKRRGAALSATLKLKRCRGEIQIGDLLIAELMERPPDHCSANLKKMSNEFSVFNTQLKN
jgi:hypothetical protein